MDFRSLIDSNGLLGFRSYLKILLDEIIAGKSENTVHLLVLERLVGYFSSYRNSGDLDFRSGEIFNEIKKLSTVDKVNLAKHFRALLEVEAHDCSELDWNQYIKNTVVKDE